MELIDNCNLYMYLGGIFVCKWYSVLYYYWIIFFANDSLLCMILGCQDCSRSAWQTVWTNQWVPAVEDNNWELEGSTLVICVCIGLFVMYLSIWWWICNVLYVFVTLAISAPNLNHIYAAVHADSSMYTWVITALFRFFFVFVVNIFTSLGHKQYRWTHK